MTRSRIALSWFLLAAAGLVLSSELAHAEASSIEESIQNGSAEPNPTPTSSKRARQSKDSNKDAEGTAAPNRFEAETVIKSQYTLDGKPLEVDPD